MKVFQQRKVISIDVWYLLLMKSFTETFQLKCKQIFIRWKKNTNQMKRYFFPMMHGAEHGNSFDTWWFFITAVNFIWTISMKYFHRTIRHEFSAWNDRFFEMTIFMFTIFIYMKYLPHGSHSLVPIRMHARKNMFSSSIVPTVFFFFSIFLFKITQFFPSLKYVVSRWILFWIKLFAWCRHYDYILSLCIEQCMEKCCKWKINKNWVNNCKNAIGKVRICSYPANQRWMFDFTHAPKKQSWII